MRLFVCLTAAASALTLAACQPADDAAGANETPPSPEAPDSATPVSEALTSEGWRTLRVGMTRAEIEAAMGADANPDAVGGSEPEACDFFRPGQAPEGLLVMLRDGALSRISVAEPATVRTADGFGVGSSAAEIKAFYGDRAVVTPHVYQEAPAEDIFVWDGARPAPNDYITDDSRRGIRYEIGGDGAVMQVHVGGPDIQLVEGCS